jgi:hypothetical protein
VGSTNKEKIKIPKEIQLNIRGVKILKLIFLKLILLKIKIKLILTMEIVNEIEIGKTLDKVANIYLRLKEKTNNPNIEFIAIFVATNFALLVVNILKNHNIINRRIAMNGVYNSMVSVYSEYK